MEQAKQFFERFSGGQQISFTELPQSGSSRRNFIAENSDGKFVVTANENLRENESFLYFSEVFSGLNLNTPNIYRVSEDRKMYIQEFLGNHTLSELISKEGLSTNIVDLIRKTLDHLFEMQQKTQGKIDYSRTFEYEKYDEFPVQHDLYYFKFFFVDQLEIPYHKSALLREFRNITQRITALKPQGLMIRDFQSRNIMIDDQDEIHFIDYQSAMHGPLIYDVISLLYQAKAGFPEPFREEMLAYYVSKFDSEDQENLMKSIPYIRLIRNLQVLGAYGFRGLIQKKKHFIDSIPAAIKSLQQLAENRQELEDFPELKMIINSLDAKQMKF